MLLIRSLSTLENSALMLRINQRFMWRVTNVSHKLQRVHDSPKLCYLLLYYLSQAFHVRSEYRLHLFHCTSGVLYWQHMSDALNTANSLSLLSTKINFVRGLFLLLLHTRHFLHCWSQQNTGLLSNMNILYRITDDKVLSSSPVDHRRATRIWGSIPCRDTEVRFYSQTLNC